VPGIGDVRGRGLLVGVELVADPATRERFPAALEVGLRVRDVARRDGLLLRASHWMIVLAPPLTIAEGEVDEVVDIVARALDEVLVGAAGAATSVG
jgi:adenosylmethionine-8-amino-7-oxononanoate aminotransferase